jgi:hypothetical protein
MPTFQRDPVAFSLALDQPRSSPTPERLRQHDADLARRYDGRAQLSPFLVAHGIEPNDTSRSYVVLLAQIFVSRSLPLPQAVEKACGFYVALREGAATPWDTFAAPVRALGAAFVPTAYEDQASASGPRTRRAASRAKRTAKPKGASRAKGGGTPKRRGATRRGRPAGRRRSR